MLYEKTEAGRNEVVSRTLPLTPAQRRVLILCDGERRVEDLSRMIPPEAVQPAVQQLVEKGLLVLREETATNVHGGEATLSAAERFRASVELATSLVENLGFAARVKAQLQIERAHDLPDLVDTVGLICRNMKQKTPQMELRLTKLRQLAGA